MPNAKSNGTVKPLGLTGGNILNGQWQKQVIGDSSGLSANSDGTSVFDPVICELCYRWFCPPAGFIIDPFAGTAVAGIVASHLGYTFTGIDLSQQQIEANKKQVKALGLRNPPKFITGDSAKIKSLTKGKFDLLFTCPPYHDLEVYSNDPRDLSAKGWGDFLSTLRLIIGESCKLLKPNRFAAIVIGDIRGPDGFYRNLPGETIEIFRQAGLRLYNEAILVTMVGSLPIRVGRQFSASRKLGKSHQNLFIFYNGDPKAIKDELGAVDVPDLGALGLAGGGNDQ